MAIALPAVLVALLGMAVLWRQTDLAVRSDTQKEAVGFAEFIATSFATVDEAPPGTPSRVAHRAVTTSVRSNWAALQVVSEVRIIDRTGVVRWSRRIEDEDRPYDDAARLLKVGSGTARFEARSIWPWKAGGGGEVVYPLGGVACAGCHTGDATLKTGVIHLTVDEPVLRQEVSDVFLRAMWSVIAFSVVLIGAMALSLRQYLTRPLSRLSAVMKRAEDGELVVRAPNMGRDEIGRLAQAFNRMLARLTALKATEIDTQRDLESVKVELALKEQLEAVNARLAHRVDEQAILYDLARTMTSTLDLNEVLSRITTQVPTKLGVPKFSIMLLNADGELEVLKARPVGSEGLRFAIGEGICGHAAMTRKSVYVADLEQDALFRVRGGEGAKGRGCLLALPMVHGGELLGVLNFERPEKADFGPEEIEFFTAVSDQAAMAVANARLHEQTVTLSITDPLTGVPNRRHLFQQLDAEIARANRFDHPLSMLMIDIDHFKHLNDTAGHRAGDDVLRQVCMILKHNVRRVDTLARYGGEEFVVLLPQVPKLEAAEVAEKLRRAVAEEPIEHARVQPGGRVTISIGVATLPIDSTDQANLVDCADSALYASKRGGRNLATMFQPGMEQHPGRERGPHLQPRGAQTPTPSQAAPS